MRLTVRDVFASCAVVLAGLLYGLWVFDTAAWGMSSVRVTGVAVLGLGFLASASAVVPGFDQLIRGNGIYLAVTSLVGLAALTGGVWVLVGAAEPGLDLLMGTTGLLWLISTVRHVRLTPGAIRETATLAMVAPGKKEAA